MFIYKHKLSITEYIIILFDPVSSMHYSGNKVISHDDGLHADNLKLKK